MKTKEKFCSDNFKYLYKESEFFGSFESRGRNFSFLAKSPNWPTVGPTIVLFSRRSSII